MYSRPIKLVIADDHEIFRDGFRLLLKNQKDIELVGEANNGKDLLNVIRDTHPDVAVIDIKMPEMDGIEATKIIHEQFSDVKVIALSMFNDDNLIIDMLGAGARGYLLKNTNKHELITATKTVHENGTYYCNETSIKLAKMIAESKYHPHRAIPAVKFTERELEVIRLLCKQFSNKEIATQLGLSTRTVETYRERIQEKTDSRNAIGIVIFAIKQGLFEI